MDQIKIGKFIVQNQIYILEKPLIGHMQAFALCFSLLLVGIDSLEHFDQFQMITSLI